MLSLQLRAHKEYIRNHKYTMTRTEQYENVKMTAKKDSKRLEQVFNNRRNETGPDLFIKTNSFVIR